MSLPSPPAGEPGAPGQMPPAAGPPEPPPPLEANDQLVAAVMTAGWAVALVVLLFVRGDIPSRERWWLWVAVAGFGMGLFGLAYVPHLKRSRARTAQRRADRPHGEPEASGGSGGSPPRGDTAG